MGKYVGNKFLAFLFVVFPIITYLLFNYEIGFMITVVLISTLYLFILILNCNKIKKYNNRIFYLVVYSEMLYLLESFGCKYSFIISIFLLSILIMTDVILK